MTIISLRLLHLDGLSGLHGADGRRGLSLRVLCECCGIGGSLAREVGLCVAVGCDRLLGGCSVELSVCPCLGTACLLTILSSQVEDASRLLEANNRVRVDLAPRFSILTLWSHL